MILSFNSINRLAPLTLKRKRKIHNFITNESLALFMRMPSWKMRNGFFFYLVYSLTPSPKPRQIVVLVWVLINDIHFFFYFFYNNNNSLNREWKKGHDIPSFVGLFDYESESESNWNSNSSLSPADFSIVLKKKKRSLISKNLKIPILRYNENQSVVIFSISIVDVLLLFWGCSVFVQKLFGDLVKM